MNELLWIVQLIGVFSLVVVLYYSFGMVGLYGWIAVVAVVANIQVQKIVPLFGMTATLGNIVYASSFLATDIICEHYGKRAARQLILFGFTIMVTVSFLMHLTLLFTPASEDFSQPALLQIFRVFPRITIASLAGYIASQLHDVWAYSLLKQRFPQKKYLWLRNNLSTLVSQLFDTLLFVLIAFYGLVDRPTLVSLMLTTYGIKVITSICDTPWIYIAKRHTPSDYRLFFSNLSRGK